MFAIGVVSIIFSIYNSYRNPQIEGDKKDAMLAQQVQWTIEGNEKRFSDMQTNIKEAFALGQNHIHTVDTKVDVLTKEVIGMAKEITRLTTIIEERIPQQKK